MFCIILDKMKLWTLEYAVSTPWRAGCREEPCRASPMTTSVEVATRPVSVPGRLTMQRVRRPIRSSRCNNSLPT